MRHLIASWSVIILTLIGPAQAEETKAFYTGITGNLAVGGYDSVAYFTDGMAQKGKKAWQVEYQGVAFRFASVANKRLFLQNPEKYVPQYGGYCAWAVAHGYTARGDPKHWRIVDGKLYLNYNGSVQRRWEQEQRVLILKGDQNWPEVLR